MGSKMIGSATQFEQSKQFQQQQWQQMKEFQAMQANQSNAYASPENFYERDNVTHSNVHRNVNNSYPHINHSACPNKINHLQRHKMEHKPNHPFPFHPSANYPRSEHQFHQSRRSEAYDAQREVKQHPQREVPEIKFNLDTLQNVLKLFNIQPNDNSQPKPAPQTRKGNAHVVRPSSPAASSCDTKAKANAHNEHPCARLFQHSKPKPKRELKPKPKPKQEPKPKLKPKPTLPALFLKLQRDQMQQNLIKIQTLTRVKRQSPLKFKILSD